MTFIGAAYIFEALMKPFEAVLRPARKIFAQFEASRTWGSVIITWSQLVTEDALEKNFSPDACAKSPVSLQASCRFFFRLRFKHTPHGGEGPYSRWGRRPEPEALKCTKL